MRAARVGAADAVTRFVKPSCDEAERPTATVDLEALPSFLLVRVVSAIQKKVTRHYLDPHGLTNPDWRVLGFVHRYEPVKSSRLTERTSLDKAQVSRTVRKLKALGLLRIAADPGHARRSVLELSAAGRRLYGRILPEAARAQQHLLLALEPAERAVFYTALRKLQAHLDSLGEATAPPDDDIPAGLD
jgi:DNA-binding MarR family transcriptional regulator